MESVVAGRSRHRRETERLNVQHEVVKYLMGGQLLRAPVDLNTPRLRVLDSGTAQANWLLDLQEDVHLTAHLVGTDIAPEQFPRAEILPSTIVLHKHSIFEPWPTDYQSSFDVVHQRFVLAACKTDEQGRNAVASLARLAKPGGWIELHEGNMLSVQEGPSHHAMMRFRALAVRAWTQLGNLPDPGARLGRWMVEAKLENIYEEKQTVKIGASAEDEEQGENALYLCMNMFDAIQRMVSGKQGYPADRELDELKSQLERELREVGNEWSYYLALGRRAQ